MTMRVLSALLRLRRVGEVRHMNSVISCTLGSKRNFASSRMSVCHLFTASPLRRGCATFKLADVGEGIAEVEVLQFYAQVGDSIEEMDNVCEVQSDKSAVSITSKYTGVITKMHCKVGDTIKIGAPLIDVEGPEVVDEAPASSSTPEKSFPSKFSTYSSTSSLPNPSISKNTAVLAAPSIRRLANQMGIDISEVKGTGPGGRITRPDVENFKSSGNDTVSTSSQSHTSQKSTSKISTEHVTTVYKDNTVQLTGMGKAMVKAMNSTLQTPTFFIADEFDVSEMCLLRQSFKQHLINDKSLHDKFSITMTTLFIKAVSLALKQVPILNSKFDSNTQSSYTVFAAHNISLAIDTAHGLVVPNIKNVQEKSLIDIQNDLIALSTRAHANKLSSSDLTGGTITVSNLGSISGKIVQSIVFDGQAAILGIGTTETVPKFDQDGDVTPRQVCNIGITADHRHIDGATAAKFNKTLKHIIEKPHLALLHLK